MEEKVPHPISRYPAKRSQKNEWEFIKETEPCTYEEAMKEVLRLELANPLWQYRLWDCR